LAGVLESFDGLSGGFYDFLAGGWERKFLLVGSARREKKEIGIGE
jgi:hypothetical protein